MFASSPFGGGFSDHGSITNFLVLGLEPEEERIRTKIAGVPVIKTFRRLFRKEGALNFQSYFLTQTRTILDSLGSLSNWFNVEEYLQERWKLFNEYLEHDKELGRYVYQLTDKPDLTEERTRTTYREAINLLYQRFKNHLRNWCIIDAREFLRSNLPLMLYTNYYRSYLSQLLVLEVLTKRSVKLETRMNIARNFMMLQRYVKEFKEEMQPLVTLSTALQDSKERFELFIKVSNAKSMAQVFEDIPFRLESMDENKYRLLYDEFERYLLNLHKLLPAYGAYLASPFEVDKSTLQFGTDLAQVVVQL